jgi:hypothetical protein
MGHAFQEKFVYVVVFDALGHLLVEVPWLSRSFNLDYYFLFAFGAVFIFL